MTITVPVDVIVATIRTLAFGADDGEWSLTEDEDTKIALVCSVIAAWAGWSDEETVAQAGNDEWWEFCTIILAMFEQQYLEIAVAR